VNFERKTILLSAQIYTDNCYVITALGLSGHAQLIDKLV